MLHPLDQKLFCLSRSARESSADAPTRPQIAVWAVLVVAALALSLADYQSFQFGVYRDDAMYTILAQSLVHSDQYGMINVPGQPGRAEFPFGFPLLLAPLVLLFPDNWDVLKGLSLTAMLVNASLLFWGWHWLSRRSRWWGAAIVGLYVLSPLTIDHTRMVMSETIFTTVCLAAVLLAERAAISPRPRRWWSVGMSVALTLVLFIRTIGLVVMLSLCAYLLLIKGRRFWQELLRIVVQMAVLVGLGVGLTSVEPRDIFPSKYVTEFKSDTLVLAAPAERPEETSIETPVVRFLFELADANHVQVPYRHFLSINAEAAELHLEKHIRQALVPLGGGEHERAFAERIGLPWLPTVLGLLVSGLIGLGYFRWFAREGLSAFNLSALFYLGALFAWLWQDTRFLYPILPQLYFGLLLGIEAVRDGVVAWRPHTPSLRKWGHGLLLAAVFILMSFSIYKSLNLDDSRRHVGDLAVRTRWLKANTSPAAIVLTEAPDRDFLYGGRKTVPMPAASSASALDDFLAQHGINYILVAPQIVWQASYTPTYSDQTLRLFPLLESLNAQNRIKLVYASEPDLVEVFEVQP